MLSTHLPMVILGRLLALFTVVLYTGVLPAQAPDSTFWVPNGPVYSLVLHDTTVIIGGNFDNISPYTGSFVRIDTSTAAVDQNYFKLNGPVYAMARDTSGRIYVGGKFTRAGNTAVNNLFRLNGDGTFDPTFNYVINGPVYSLLVDSLLYIGGEFTFVDADARHNMAAVGLDSVNVTEFDADVNGPVFCMALDTIFDAIVIGGDFTQVGPYFPPYIAKVEKISGFPLHTNAIPWTATPNCNGPVYDMEIIYNRLIFAGEFAGFSSISRPGIARLDIYYGNVTSADAQVNGSVYAIDLVDDTLLYIAGKFNSVLGQPRNNLACVSPILDTLYAWNPVTNGTVRTIELIDSMRFFVGGIFTRVEGDTCIRGAIVTRSDTGVVDNNWNPKINDTVFAAVRDTSGRLYIGGSFFAIGGVDRNNLCAVSMNSGTVTAWDPNANNTVRTMTLDGDSLYFAGDFTTVGGSNRGRMAAIDLNTYSLLPFNPVVGGIARTIAVTDAFVYAGGNFNSYGGSPRNNIGKVSKTTGLAIPWSPNCLGTVNTIQVTPNWIYVSGFFNTISGQPRQNMARIHPVTAAADLTWICNTDDGIYHAEFYNGKLAIAGWFDGVNGNPSPDFAIVDTTTLQLSPLNFNCDMHLNTFTTFGDDFFMAGPFTLVNINYQPNLVAYDAGNDAVDPWTPFPDEAPLVMQATSSRLFIGGTMTTTAGRFHPYFQVLPIQWVTSIDDQEASSQQLQLYPNPTSNSITVNDVAGYSDYTLTDIAGNVVMSGPISGNTLEITLENLSAGIYFVNVTGEEQAPVSQKVVKQ